MSEILVHVTRGDKVENIHRGDVVVVDDKKNIIAGLGDPYKLTFMRSCAKPIQALPVVESGAVDAYGISQRELAVMCASHYSETFHTEAIRSILEKAGLDESYLQCGETYSLRTRVTTEFIRNGEVKKRIYNNCSGKHAGMLALAKKEGYDLATYHMTEHPVQQSGLQTVAEACDLDKREIGIAIDGCGVPVFELPIFNMALSFARFAKGTLDLTKQPVNVDPEKRRTAAKRIIQAMQTYPEMVAGTGGFCTELMRHTKGKLIGKLGADGVYCVGVLDTPDTKGGIGIAVKVESGNMHMLSCIVLETLKQLGLLNPEEENLLQRFYIKDNINTCGSKVGEIKPVFRLQIS